MVFIHSPKGKWLSTTSFVKYDLNLQEIIQFIKKVKSEFESEGDNWIIE